MKKYIVYLTTNIKNNKIYVGVHGTEQPDIFDGYLGNGLNIHDSFLIKNPKEPFHFAVKKYGFNAFKRSTIKVFDKLEDALELEAEIVDENFIKREDTYNITLGGGCPPILKKTIYEYTLEGNFVKEWESIKAAGEFYNTSSASIGQAVLWKRTSANKLWSDCKVDKLNISEYNVYDPKIPIHIYNEFGEYEKTFSSISECVKYLDSNIAHIQRAVKLGIMVKNYYISKTLSKNYIKPVNPRLTGMVHQYDLDGHYIKSYNSVKEVETVFGETMQGINPSIKMGEMYKGFLWLRGEKEEFVKPYKTPKCSARKVGQYTMDGKLVKVFNTVREARKEFPNVGKVLNGNANHCHNFKFKYLE